ncbi:uncharacterized protein LOC133568393 isoform X3 [Nerophis ophidion]|nr:uncharacterized protein LOC133568393 isoform X3 [Nerophis ophidion]
MRRHIPTRLEAGSNGSSSRLPPAFTGWEEYHSARNDGCHRAMTTPSKLETVEELLDIDELIKTQPSKKDLLTARLSKIGYDLKSCLSTIMDRLMTNELTSNLNMKGGGGKTAFAETKLLDVVTELVSWIPRRGPKRWSMMPLKIN